MIVCIKIYHKTTLVHTLLNITEAHVAVAKMLM